MCLEKRAPKDLGRAAPPPCRVCGRTFLVEPGTALGTANYWVERDLCALCAGRVDAEGRRLLPPTVPPVQGDE